MKNRLFNKVNKIVKKENELIKAEGGYNEEKIEEFVKLAVMFLGFATAHLNDPKSKNEMLDFILDHSKNTISKFDNENNPKYN